MPNPLETYGVLMLKAPFLPHATICQEAQRLSPHSPKGAPSRDATPMSPMAAEAADGDANHPSSGI